MWSTFPKLFARKILRDKLNIVRYLGLLSVTWACWYHAQIQLIAEAAANHKTNVQYFTRDNTC